MDDLWALRPGVGLGGISEGFIVAGLFLPQACNPCPALVKGAWYRAMILGIPFVFWVAGPLGRHAARAAALEFAGDDVYEYSEIESVRRISARRAARID